MAAAVAEICYYLVSHSAAVVVVAVVAVVVVVISLQHLQPPPAPRSAEAMNVQQGKLKANC